MLRGLESKILSSFGAVGSSVGLMRSFAIARRSRLLGALRKGPK
jgi:hypothetical protein